MPSSRPEISLPASLAVGALVVSIYGRGLPPLVDVRDGEPGEANADAMRRANAWTAAGVVAGVSLIARDTTIFVVGSFLIIGLDWLTRHAVWFDPYTGSAAQPGREDQMVPTQEMADDEYGALAVVG